MTTSEPTTGEIVRAFRGAGVYGITTALELKIIDRLESQERELETLRAFHERYAEQTSTQYVVAVCGLTARAEHAEAREKAIIESVRDRCEFCIGYELEESDGPCSTCYNARTFEPDDIPRTKNWTWRGLPQEGEQNNGQANNDHLR